MKIAAFNSIAAQIEDVALEYQGYLTSQVPVSVNGRASSPEHAYRLITGWAKSCGVTRLAETTRLDRIGIPTFYAVRPSARHSCAIIASGKGTTRANSILSALFEAHERWAAESPAGPSFAASSEALSSAFTHIPRIAPTSLDHDEVVWWTVGFELCRRQPCFVPLQAVAFPNPTASIKSCPLLSTTNGLSSGTNCLEAIGSGILELIERDALQRLSSPPRVLVDPNSLPPRVRNLFDLFGKQDVTIRLFQCPSPTGIPVFYSISRDDCLGLSVLFCSGAGAHASAEIAASRALTEVAQSRAGFICSIREDVSYRIRKFEGIDYGRRRKRLASWFDDAREIRRFGDIPSWNIQTFGQQIDRLVQGLQTVDRDLKMASITLKKWPNLSAFRVYSPFLLPPHPEEEHQWDL